MNTTANTARGGWPPGARAPTTQGILTCKLCTPPHPATPANSLPVTHHTGTATPAAAGRKEKGGTIGDVIVVLGIIAFGIIGVYSSLHPDECQDRRPFTVLNSTLRG